MDEFKRIRDCIRDDERAAERRASTRLLITNLLASVGLMTALLSIIYIHTDQIGVAAVMASVGVALFALSFLGDTE